ncbi:MAG TPA: DNA polymerase IV [Jatrophihabitans sp.]|jgi:DNA polymerase-4
MGRSGDLPRQADDLGTDDSGCTILHVDMDAFFASVEIQRRPELKGLPVVVGGQQRGVVAAASYEARKYGVRSAMPMTRALRLCPKLVVISPDGAAYRAVSQQVMAIFADVTPLVQPLSVDEAFLDVSGSVRLLGRPTAIATAIRKRVQDELDLTCSVGVAATKFVAKLASARCKPDGLLVVPAAETLTFLHPLPVNAIWGVGAKTAEALHRLGIHTVADAAATPRETLVRALGPASAAHIHDLARGIDPRQVEANDVEKSISADRTLAEDLTSSEQVHRELLRVAGEVGRRLREREFVARTVGIKIRFSDFHTITRVRTLPEPVDSTAVLHEIAVELYEALALDRPLIRLVGVKAENLLSATEVAAAPQQLSLESLFAEQEPSVEDVAERSGAQLEARRKAESVLDAARTRFGAAGLKYAALLRSGPESDPTRSLSGGPQ